MTGEITLEEQTKQTLANREATLAAANEQINFANTLTNSAGALSAYNNVMSMSNNLIGEFQSYWDKSLENIKSNTTALTMFSVAAVGTRESFKGVFDSRELNTFTGQLRNLNDIPAISALATRLGVVLPESVKKSVGAAKDFVMGLAESADNALRLQHALFRMSATTGSLGTVTQNAGNEFENMNEILHVHQKMVTDTGIATQTSAAVVEEYYMQLGQVPGALESTVRSSQDTNNSISMLTATMQFAAGSGRNYAEIVDDLKTAYRNMGIQGENALKFTARMGEISNKFGIELATVRSALNSTTDQLKMFGGEHLRNGDIIQGSIRLMNDYVGALKSTGISGSAAIGVVQQMTNQVASLDVAQRAFLSQQSGGPGGLRGAFRVEQMIRDGKIDQVMKDVQSTMQKQFGRIVTNEEAAGSEAAASRAVMQRQMLMRGPLGQFAKSEQDAARILEAFSARSSGKITEEQLKDSIVQETMDKGLMFQETSMTHLGVIRGLMEESRGNANIGALSLAQNTTARAGSVTSDNDSIPEQERTRENLREASRNAAIASGERAGQTVTAGSRSSTSTNIAQEATEQSFKNWQDFFRTVPDAIKIPILKIKKMLESDSSVQDIQKEAESLNERIRRIRAEAKATKGAKRRQELLDEATAEQNALTRLNDMSSALRTTTSVPSSVLPDAAEQARSRNVQSPGANVGEAADRATRTAPTNDADATEEVEAQGRRGRTTASAEPHVVHVRVSGYCIDCGKPIPESEQRAGSLPV